MHLHILLIGFESSRRNVTLEYANFGESELPNTIKVKGTFNNKAKRQMLVFLGGAHRGKRPKPGTNASLSPLWRVGVHKTHTK